MSSGHPFSTDRSGAEKLDVQWTSVQHRPERRTCDISVTLNTYTHVGFGDAQEEMRRVAEA